MSQRGEGAKRVLKDLGLSINDEQHERKQDTDADTDEDSEVCWRAPTSALGLDTSRAGVTRAMLCMGMCPALLMDHNSPPRSCASALPSHSAPMRPGAVCAPGWLAGWLPG